MYVGVIDAIAEGCFAVARRPYVLILPVALDLFAWLGARLTATPLLEALLGAAQRGGAVDQGALDLLRSTERDANLFSLLALGINTLTPAVTPGQIARPWPQGVIDLGAWPWVVLSALALALLGVFCLACYLAVVAQVVRDEPFSLRRIVRRAPVYSLRLLGLGAVIVGGLLLMGLPVLFLAGLLTLAGASAGPLLTLLFIPLVWLYCYLALAPEAIVMSDAGPLQAIKLSVRVVRRNFWPVLRLLAATLLILQGFPVLWQLLARQVAGVPLAIVGNAFLATGMTAAGMAFYRERLAALDQPASKGASTNQGPARRP